MSLWELFDAQYTHVALDEVYVLTAARAYFPFDDMFGPDHRPGWFFGNANIVIGKTKPANPVTVKDNPDCF